MLRLKIMLNKDIFGKIFQVKSDDYICAASNRSSKDMSIIRIGKSQRFNKRTIVTDEAI